MIPYNFQYYQPTTIKEATNLFQSLLQENKSPIYFAGGTEVITLGRMNKIVTDAVIDINKENAKTTTTKKRNNLKKEANHKKISNNNHNKIIRFDN